VPERPVFFPWLKGEEIIALTARQSGIEMEERRRKTGRLADRIAFATELLDRRVPTYSLGNQKKFAYLQSLLIDPELLIVDEPFSSLDPYSIRMVRDLFLEMKKDGKTLFLSSHLISEMEKIADEFIIIKKGHIVVQGDLDHLMGICPSASDLESLYFFFTLTPTLSRQGRGLGERKPVED
jgi:ABC-2 type transport system ATP-binding protein